jgi:hypothetical protein
VLSCVAITGCSAFVPYQSESDTEDRLTRFDCYSRFYLVYLESCRVTAVDGFRPGVSQMFGGTARIPPGTHWIELAFERFVAGAGGVTDVCAFDITIQAGTRYQVVAHSLKTAIPTIAKHGQAGLYAGSLELELDSPSGGRAIVEVGVSCSAFGGSLCRRDADCVDHPDMRCLPQPGFSFGRCRLKDSG